MTAHASIVRAEARLVEAPPEATLRKKRSAPATGWN